MLHPREREYVADPIKFEDKYGLDNAKMTRSRIRGRITKAFEDLILVIKQDQKYQEGMFGRNPTLEKLKRDGVESKSRFSCGTKHQNPMFNNYNDMMNLIKTRINIDYDPVRVVKSICRELEEFIKEEEK
jgi:hypothetical protein